MAHFINYIHIVDAREDSRWMQRDEYLRKAMNMKSMSKLVTNRSGHDELLHHIAHSSLI